MCIAPFHVTEWINNVTLWRHMWSFSKWICAQFRLLPIWCMIGGRDQPILWRHILYFVPALSGWPVGSADCVTSCIYLISCQKLNQQIPVPCVWLGWLMSSGGSADFLTSHRARWRNCRRCCCAQPPRGAQQSSRPARGGSHHHGMMT